MSDARHIALYDVDGTLTSPDGKSLNTTLIDAHLATGAPRDVILFTTMTTKTFLDEMEDEIKALRTGNAYYGRFAVIDELKKRGINVLSVLTPMDAIEGGEIGKGFKEFTKLREQIFAAIKDKEIDLHQLQDLIANVDQANNQPPILEQARKDDNTNQEAGRKFITGLNDAGVNDDIDSAKSLMLLQLYMREGESTLSGIYFDDAKRCRDAATFIQTALTGADNKRELVEKLAKQVLGASFTLPQRIPPLTVAQFVQYNPGRNVEVDDQKKATYTETEYREKYSPVYRNAFEEHVDAGNFPRTEADKNKASYHAVQVVKDSLDRTLAYVREMQKLYGNGGNRKKIDQLVADISNVSHTVNRHGYLKSDEAPALEYNMAMRILNKALRSEMQYVDSSSNPNKYSYGRMLHTIIGAVREQEKNVDIRKIAPNVLENFDPPVLAVIKSNPQAVSDKLAMKIAEINKSTPLNTMLPSGSSSTAAQRPIAAITPPSASGQPVDSVVNEESGRPDYAEDYVHQFYKDLDNESETPDEPVAKESKQDQSGDALQKDETVREFLDNSSENNQDEDEDEGYSSRARRLEQEENTPSTDEIDNKSTVNEPRNTTPTTQITTSTNPAGKIIPKLPSQPLNTLPTVVAGHGEKYIIEHFNREHPSISERRKNETLAQNKIKISAAILADIRSAEDLQELLKDPTKIASLTSTDLGTAASIAFPNLLPSKSKLDTNEIGRFQFPPTIHMNFDKLFDRDPADKPEDAEKARIAKRDRVIKQYNFIAMRAFNSNPRDANAIIHLAIYNEFLSEQDKPLIEEELKKLVREGNLLAITALALSKAEVDYNQGFKLLNLCIESAKKKHDVAALREIDEIVSNLVIDVKEKNDYGKLRAIKKHINLNDCRARRFGDKLSNPEELAKMMKIGNKLLMNAEEEAKMTKGAISAIIYNIDIASTDPDGHAKKSLEFSFPRNIVVLSMSGDKKLAELYDTVALKLAKFGDPDALCYLVARDQVNLDEGLIEAATTGLKHSADKGNLLAKMALVALALERAEKRKEIEKCLAMFEIYEMRAHHSHDDDAVAYLKLLKSLPCYQKISPESLVVAEPADAIDRCLTGLVVFHKLLSEDEMLGTIKHYLDESQDSRSSDENKKCYTAFDKFKAAVGQLLKLNETYMSGGFKDAKSYREKQEQLLKKIDPLKITLQTSSKLATPLPFLNDLVDGLKNNSSYIARVIAPKNAKAIKEFDKIVDSFTLLARAWRDGKKNTTSKLLTDMQALISKAEAIVSPIKDITLGTNRRREDLLIDMQLISLNITKIVESVQNATKPVVNEVQRPFGPHH